MLKFLIRIDCEYNNKNLKLEIRCYDLFELCFFFEFLGIYFEIMNVNY